MAHHDTKFIAAVCGYLRKEALQFGSVVRLQLILRIFR